MVLILGVFLVIMGGTLGVSWEEGVEADRPSVEVAERPAAEEADRPSE